MNYTFILPENEFHDSRDKERERGREERAQGSELPHAGKAHLPHVNEAHLTSNISDLSLPHAGKTLPSNPPSTIPDPPKTDPPKQRSTPPLPHHRSTNTQDPHFQSPAKTHPSHSPITNHAPTSTS